MDNEYGIKTGIPIWWDLVPEEQEEGQSPAGHDPQERKDFLGVKSLPTNHSTSESSFQGEEL